MNKKNLGFLPYVMVLLAIGLRFAPHPANATPIVAIALFAGVYFNRRLSIVLPIVAMFLSDLLIGFYSWPIMAAVYGSFAVVGVMGWWLAKHRGVATTIGTSLAGSTLFFLVTNWAVWQFSSLYIHTPAGLMQSYVAGLPFYRNMLLGDLFYVGVLFGAYALVTRLAEQKKAEAKA